MNNMSVIEEFGGSRYFWKPVSACSSVILNKIVNLFWQEEEEKSLFRIVEETRKLYMELSTSDQDERKREQLQQTEQKLLEYLDRNRLKG